MPIAKTTLNDIATRLHVSKSLVSRALSGKYNIDESTRRIIQETAAEMGYDFHRLRSGKDVIPPKEQSSILLVMLRFDLGDINYYSHIVTGIQTELQQCRVNTMLELVEFDTKTLQLPKQIKGVIAIGRLQPELLTSIIEQNPQIVLLDNCTYHGFYCDTVTAANYAGCYDSTARAIASGHRRLAFVGSPDYSNSFAERYRGFMDCIRLTPEVQGVSLTGTYDNIQIPCDYKQLVAALSHPDHPTAFICANDIIAAIVYDIAEKLGLNIPNQISVVGFDNIDKSTWMRPSLSTVAVPMQELGRCAVQTLLNRIQKPESPYRNIQLMTSFVDRDSIQPISSN